MSESYILLGGNIDNRFQYLNRAEYLIKNVIGDISKSSSFYESEPWGFVHKNAFLNKVILVNTYLSPNELLLHINQIENMMGRIRKSDQYIERNIDIDILFYDNQIINEESLIVPHPKIQFRRFTLLPLSEIAPSLIHPVLNKPINELLINCEDQLTVRKLSDDEVNKNV